MLCCGAVDHIVHILHAWSHWGSEEAVIHTLTLNGISVPDLVGINFLFCCRVHLEITHLCVCAHAYIKGSQAVYVTWDVSLSSSSLTPIWCKNGADWATFYMVWLVSFWLQARTLQWVTTLTSPHDVNLPVWEVTRPFMAAEKSLV